MIIVNFTLTVSNPVRALPRKSGLGISLRENDTNTKKGREI